MKETELSVTVLVNGWFAEHLRQLRTEGERQAARAKGAQGVLMAAWQRELQAPVMSMVSVVVLARVRPDTSSMLSVSRRLLSSGSGLILRP